MKNSKKPVREIPLPPYITIEDDTEFGGLYSSVNAAFLAGRKFSHSEIIAALAKPDRAQAAKELNSGFNAVYLIDLKSGATAIHMCKHTKPCVPGRAALKIRAAIDDCHRKYCDLRESIIRQAVALKQIRLTAPEATTKRAK